MPQGGKEDFCLQVAGGLASGSFAIVEEVGSELLGDCMRLA